MPGSFQRQKFKERNPSIRVVTFNDIKKIFNKHNLMVKIIWSGMGDKGSNNKLVHGKFDDFYWDKLALEVRDPENDTEYFGNTWFTSDKTTHSSTDRSVDRTQRFDQNKQQWTQRPITNNRGNVRKGKITTKAKHFTLYAPNKNMPYCRGLLPDSGIKCTSNVANYDANSQSFPGMQIGLLCNADASVGTIVEHCLEQDMYGRRLPWLGGQTRVNSVVPYTSQLKDLASLKTWQNKQTSFTQHNDCRVKLARESSCGILIPDDCSSLSKTVSLLVKVNAIYRKLKWLEDNGDDLPIVIKAENDKKTTELTLQAQWQALLTAATNLTFSKLLIQMPIHLMTLDNTTYKSLITANGNEHRFLTFICKIYRFNTPLPQNSTLNSTLLKFILQQNSVNLDLVCALLEAGLVPDASVKKQFMPYIVDLKLVMGEKLKATFVLEKKMNDPSLTKHQRKRAILMKAFEVACVKYNKQSLAWGEKSERNKNFGLLSSLRHSERIDSSTKSYAMLLYDNGNDKFLRDTYDRIKNHRSDWREKGNVHSFNSYFLDEIKKLSLSFFSEIIKNSVNIVFYNNNNSTDIVLYRSDSRKPSIIFKSGFTNQMPDADNKNAYIGVNSSRYAYGATGTYGVSTSPSQKTTMDYIKDGYYEYQIKIRADYITALLPIDMDQTLMVKNGKRRGIQEINFVKTIPKEFICSARKYGYFGFETEVILNSKYNSSAYPIVDYLQQKQKTSIAANRPSPNPTTNTTTTAAAVVNSQQTQYVFHTSQCNNNQKIKFTLSKGKINWVHMVFTTENDADTFIKENDLKAESNKNKGQLKSTDDRRYPGFFCVRMSPKLYKDCKNGAFAYLQLPDASDIKQQQFKTS